MLAGTHIAIACAIGTMSGASTTTLSLLSFGSLLPDIDLPQSTIGRICFFASVPLHRRFGHRRLIHGFPLWSLVTLLGFAWGPLWWIGLGALSHCFVDCLNVSGTQALLPFNQRVCVLLTRKWRFPCGSRTELGFMVIVAIAAYAFAYVGSLGGMRAVVGQVTRSPKMAFQQYREAGLVVSHFVGTLRFRSGLVEEGRWLVIGSEGEHGLAIWDEGRTRMIHVPKDADFLRVTLERGGEAWQSVVVNGFARTRADAFFYDTKKWRHAGPGGVVFGSVIGREVVIEKVGE